MVRDEQRKAVALESIRDTMLARGSESAPLTIEFYADLQSPVSKRALDLVEQARGQFGGRVRLQFRSFPLAFHAQAGLAHEAAMGAARIDGVPGLAELVALIESALKTTAAGSAP